MALRHGISTSTYEQYLVGPGAVYYNWQSNAVPGTALGETKGGNIFEVIPTFHEYAPDGAYGHIEDHTRISGMTVRLTANLYNVTAANILKALAGSASANYNIIHVPSEYIGKATAGADAWTPVGTGNILFDTLNVYEDLGAGAGPTLLVKDTDYTVNETTGTITEVGTGSYTLNAHILVEYDYDGGTGGTMTIITQGQLVTGDELTNIALVGEITDVNKAYDVVCILENALAMNGLTLSLPGGSREAAVLQVVFEGHWTVADPTLAGAPYSIRYDAA